MPIKWLRTALRNLDHHANYIAKENPGAAGRAVERVQAAVGQLTQYPGMGRIGRVAGTRELIVGGTPWIIVYRVRADAVEIIRVLHGAQNGRHSRDFNLSGYPAPGFFSAVDSTKNAGSVAVMRP